MRRERMGIVVRTIRHPSCPCRLPRTRLRQLSGFFLAAGLLQRDVRAGAVRRTLSRRRPPWRGAA